MVYYISLYYIYIYISFDRERERERSSKTFNEHEVLSVITDIRPKEKHVIF